MTSRLIFAKQISIVKSCSAMNDDESLSNSTKKKMQKFSIRSFVYCLLIVVIAQAVVLVDSTASVPITCDASKAPLNGKVGNCTAALESGK